MTVPRFLARKGGTPLAVLTAYDYTMARILDAAGVDALLVGDSLGMVVQGRSTTVGVTLDAMIYHGEMVARAAEQALVIVDLPFGTYEASARQAVKSASRVLKQTGAASIKIEGGAERAGTIRALVDAGIPVMAHIGLRPQSVHLIGGMKVQRDRDRLLSDAQAVAAAGAYAVVLELVPVSLAAEATASIPIPTIGIGAGPHCDGQVLVVSDMLGLQVNFQPRFLKRYATLHDHIETATRNYVREVQERQFPAAEHGHS